ncbi:MAG: hypothetical protein P1U80_13360 [Pseudomonadales bacterium]|jgi:hypothetical protein|nr:hypothetical protein [Pseudomonadales bacterium]
MESSTGVFETILFPALGVIVTVTVVVWFYQLTKLFNYLKLNHPDAYKEMGEPAIFTNNTPSNNVAFLKFLLGCKHKELGDNHLEQWCKFLARFLYVYVVLFLGLFVYLIGGGANAS